MSDYPIFIMKAAEDRYLLIFKHNYMCLSCASTLDKITECVKQWYIKSHGDLYNYLMDCMTNLSYNPKPSETTLLSRKSAEKESTDMFDAYIKQAFTQANDALKQSVPKTLKKPAVKTLSTDKTSDTISTKNKLLKSKIKPKTAAKKHKPIVTDTSTVLTNKKNVLKKKNKDILCLTN